MELVLHHFYNESWPLFHQQHAKVLLNSIYVLVLIQTTLLPKWYRCNLWPNNSQYKKPNQISLKLNTVNLKWRKYNNVIIGSINWTSKTFSGIVWELILSMHCSSVFFYQYYFFLCIFLFFYVNFVVLLSFLHFFYGAKDISHSPIHEMYFCWYVSSLISYSHCP